MPHERTVGHVSHDRREIPAGSMSLGFATLGCLLVLLLIRALTVWELRSLNSEHRQIQHQISETEQDLDTSRRKYLIALKAEGVAKHKTSQARTNLAGRKQHLEQLELTDLQHGARKEKELEQKLEAIVMDALGGASVRRDSQFKSVMKVINQLIDLEKRNEGGDLITAIQQKIKEMGREGLVEAAEKGGIQEPTVAAAGQPKEEDESMSDSVPATEGAPKETAPAEKAPASAEGEAESEKEPASDSVKGRRSKVRDAIVKGRR